jgi:hypothetical protein
MKYKLLMLNILSAGSFVVNGMCTSAHAYPGEPASLNFPVVSAENCMTDEQNRLYNCRFPNINVREISEKLAPLPYESVIEVKTARSCQLDSRNSVLQVRLGKLEHGSDPFLRYEDLSIAVRGKTISTAPHSMPIGSVSIYPRISDVFQQSVFPQGCKISIRVQLNRISIQTQEEATAHLDKLKSQLNLAKRTNEALELMQACSHQNRESSQLLQNFQSNLSGAHSNVLECRNQWQVLEELLPTARENVRQNGALFPDLEDFMEAIGEFSSLISSSITEENPASRSFKAVLERFQSVEFRNNHRRINQLFDANTLARTHQQIEAAKVEIGTVKRSLRYFFDSRLENTRFQEMLREIVRQEVLDPHGAVDEIIHGLSRIGKTR